MSEYCDCGDEIDEHESGGCNLCDCRKTHRDFLFALRAESERLREALEKIAALYGERIPEEEAEKQARFLNGQVGARAALAKREEHG